MLLFQLFNNLFVILGYMRETAVGAVLYAVFKYSVIASAFLFGIKRAVTEKAVYPVQIFMAGIIFTFPVFEKFITHINQPYKLLL